MRGRGVGFGVSQSTLCPLKPALIESPRVIADGAGPIRETPAGTIEENRDDPFERCNLWLLHSALAWGPEKLRFICLWDGGGGDGPGGTAHMYREVARRTGQMTWIDMRTFE